MNQAILWQAIDSLHAREGGRDVWTRASDLDCTKMTVRSQKIEPYARTDCYMAAMLKLNLGLNNKSYFGANGDGVCFADPLRPDQRLNPRELDPMQAAGDWACHQGEISCPMLAREQTQR